MKRLASILLCAALCATARAQTGWQYITFHFQREAPMERYTIAVTTDGDGWYWEGEPDLDLKKVPEKSLKAIHVRAGTLGKMGIVMGLVEPGRCETHEKNIAQTGQKTLVVTYVGGGDPHVSCKFNWSDDEHINAAASAFQAVAETLHAGDRLKHKHRFDHLGLDAELDTLTESVKSGYAIELQNIAPILQSIVDDDEMMSPARRKAKNLLEMPGVQPVASAR